ncbi:SHC SH2 domain-binding protein 1 homolog A [Xenopus laevis]|uniref:SHC SH2 domain-binding protein 1 homolog A n=2 Tax=Xenopus laevis TaxID=8355 RepID=SHCBA_XENLA|nr:SHC SH2 domain-binding protein 1 homolog A [Xenopus laevis]Q6GPE9.1 RecName: Full=SHC SH2 domain-binding protein 1 homolog A [Xenopus laevis]AAH73190.1 MGC80432 protein [Xenopus laevis]
MAEAEAQFPPLQDGDDFFHVGSDRCSEELRDVKQVLFQEEDDSASDYGSYKRLGKVTSRTVPAGNMLFPDLFQTNNLLFYERFETYKDYMLGDCKPSEVKEFIAEYLEKALKPSGWNAIWHTDVFDVLVEVTDVEFSSLNAIVRLSEPFLCESHVSSIALESIKDLLDVKDQRVPLQEIRVVFDESGLYNQTALAIEHLRFFYQQIWRPWDEEEEDYFDYFVRCVEPRLRLHYDILEDRIPSGLVAEYSSLLLQCEEVYMQFTNLRNNLSNKDSDSESELDNVSMVEGMKMDNEMENLKRKLKLIENPLLRYLFCYQRNSGCHNVQAKGPRPNGGKVIHVVSTSMSILTLQCLTRERLQPESGNKDLEIQFHRDPLEAVNACYEGDLVIICPGLYAVYGLINIMDSIEIEGYGLPDDVVIEKMGKGDTFVACSGAHIKISNVKFVQHEAVEGIITIHSGKTELDNCVLQCETTGVTVKKSAELLMKYSDLYGAKGAGMEIYPGSKCTLIGNGIHHCRDGILIKDFIDVVCEIPKITMENNVIHNNEGYAVVLVKPSLDIEKNSHNEELEGGHLDDDDKMIEEQTSSNILQPNLNKAMGVEDKAVEHTNNLEKDQGNLAIAKEEVECEYAIDCEEAEGNQVIATELVANTRRKTKLHKKRLSTLGIVTADDKLTSQEIFVSIVGNQFKRNGKGTFGTFLF